MKNPLDIYYRWALKRKHYLFWGVIVVLIVVAIVVFDGLAVSGADHTDWNRMVTIATYDHGKKIEVRESILWAIGFLAFVLFTNIGRKS